jgi:hypothetical protein
MTTNVESRQSGSTVDDLITRFDHATQPREIELLADLLADARDPRAIRALLERLSDSRVQEDRDVEDAVCQALTALGVMYSSGNLSFSLRPKNALPDDVVRSIRDLSGVIPWRYFGTARN